MSVLNPWVTIIIDICHEHFYITNLEKNMEGAEYGAITIFCHEYFYRKNMQIFLSQLCCVTVHSIWWVLRHGWEGVHAHGLKCLDSHYFLVENDRKKYANFLSQLCCVTVHSIWWVLRHGWEGVHTHGLKCLDSHYFFSWKLDHCTRNLNFDR